MRLACTSSITARQFVLNTPAAIFFTFIRGLQYDHSHYTMVMNSKEPRPPVASQRSSKLANTFPTPCLRASIHSGILAFCALRLDLDTL
jgi:hypothetical protein